MSISEALSNKLKAGDTNINDELEEIIDIATQSGDIRGLSLEIKHTDKGRFICSKFSSSTLKTFKDSFELVASDTGDYTQALGNYQSYLLNGVRAVNIINDVLEKYQRENLRPLSIAYKFGISNKFCKIASWDYSTIEVKLSRDSIIEITKIYTNLGEEAFKEHIGHLIEQSEWADNIVDAIETFNKVHFNCEIEAVLGAVAIEDILTENMLSVDDIIGIIKQGSQMDGVQKFRSIFILKELGKFIALVDWNVNYGKKTVTTSIVDEKALDLENKRFISDPSIYSRIEHRASLSDEVIGLLF